MMSASLKRFPPRLQGRWAVLVLMAVWLMTIGGVFKVLSPAETPIDRQSMTALTGVVATVVFGLVAVLLVMRVGAGCTRGWALTVFSSLVVSVVAFYCYYDFRMAWTVTESGRVHYIGTTRKASVNEWIEQTNLEAGTTHEYTPKELLEKDRWDPGEIWTAESIQRCRLILAALQITCTILFGLSVVFTAQLLSNLRDETVEDGQPLGEPGGAEPIKTTEPEEAEPEEPTAGFVPQAETKPAARPSRNRIFISYSHADTPWLLELQKMLKPLTGSGELTVWDDTNITPGRKWRDAIWRALSSCRIAVLLVSPNFLASEFIVKQELPCLLEAAERDGLTVLWVAVSDSLYTETKIAEYQPAHDPEEPLDTLSPPELNRALVDICKKLKKAYAEGGGEPTGEAAGLVMLPGENGKTEKARGNGDT